jgi:phosphotriesterase-related protein
MMKRAGKIQTVLGLIEPAELGYTQTHEHLLVNLLPPGIREGLKGEPITLENIGHLRRNWLSNVYNLYLDDEKAATGELQKFKNSGGDAIVELTVIGIDRNPEALARISRATGVHIVMGTGYYTAACHPAEIEGFVPDKIADILVGEFENGAAETAIHPGIIGEIGLDWPVHPKEEKALRAAALAQIQTGAALNIHPGRAPEAPLDAIRIVKETGGNPERVVMSHIDRTLFSMDAVLKLAETGCYLEYDLFGQESSYYPISDIDMPNDATRIDYIMGLIGHGYRDKILVSEDICHKTQLSRYGGDGYNHILDNVLPIMRRKGMTEEDIKAVTVGNPARMLAFV